MLALGKPAICEQFGIDFPLFAFSHCRDVVAAVTNAGGFGVLGATAYTPEQCDQELSDYRCTRPADVAADPDSVGRRR